MIEHLCPDEVHATLFDIDLVQLWDRGIRGIIFDVDNTLVQWGGRNVPSDVASWIENAKKMGFRLCIASNGVSERVEALAKGIGIPAITRAVKPRKKPFRNALALLGTTSRETAVVGDQIFTDVFGGNRANMYTILINPVSEKELRHTRLIRKVEKKVVRSLHKKGLLSENQMASRLFSDND